MMLHIIKAIIFFSDFCKNLARKDGDRSSSDEEGEYRPSSDDDQEKPFIHHPFKVKDASNIVLNIRVTTVLYIWP